MIKLKIYFADDVVQINDELFRPIFYDIISLTQEFNDSVANGQPYNYR